MIQSCFNPLMFDDALYGLTPLMLTKKYCIEEGNQVCWILCALAALR